MTKNYNFCLVLTFFFDSRLNLICILFQFGILTTHCIRFIPRYGRNMSKGVSYLGQWSKFLSPYQFVRGGHWKEKRWSTYAQCGNYYSEIEILKYFFRFMRLISVFRNQWVSRPSICTHYFCFENLGWFVTRRRRVQTAYSLFE